MKIRRLLCILVIALLSSLCAAQDLTIAAAADLQFAMQDLAARFHQQTGTNVQVTYGSSGNFYQQLSNGAPFDMFFSANLDYAKKLEAAGLTVPGSYYQYAQGKIALWAPNGSKVDLGAGMGALLEPAVQKIAIANPQHAPYGQAAVSALKKEGLYDQVQSKLVLGENISQTASFVVSGSADIGVIALSLALSPNMKDKGRFLEVPPGDYPPIEQACVIMRRAGNKQALAEQFLAMMKSAETAATLRSYGFEVPSPTREP
ncbi:MAG TPA: molybdate ABC transporter substrate-binding protein [Terriglobales bacterium]|nr:molybdate ABC transporter substrate-binding protein [Terriglobales bacterium]